MSQRTDVVKTRCPSCEKKLGFPAAAVGRKAKCPACEHTFRIPEAEAGSSATGAPASGKGPEAPPVRSADDRIKLPCPTCGKNLVFPAAAAGRKAKCAGCEHVFLIPAGTAKQQPAAEPSPVPAVPVYAPASPQDEETSAHDEPDGLYDLAAAEESAEVVAQVPSLTAQALSDFSRPQASAVAGRTYSQRGTFQDEAATRGRLAVMVGEGTAQLIKGTAYSAAGAIFGAFIWFAVAKATDLELGYIACGLGVMAGLGMHIGMNAESLLGGFLAAMMAFGGIILAKVMIVAWILLPMVNAEMKKEGESFSAKRQAVITYQIEQATEDIDTTTEEGERKADAAEEQVRYRLMHTQADEINKLYENLPPDAKNETELEVPGFAIVLAGVLLGFRNIFYVLLAVGSAFKVGWSGITLGKG